MTKNVDNFILLNGGTKTLERRRGLKVVSIISANTTLNINSPKKGDTFEITAIQDVTGSWTLTIGGLGLVGIASAPNSISTIFLKYTGSVFSVVSPTVPTLQQVMMAGNVSTLPLILRSPNPSRSTTIRNQNNSGADLIVDMPGGGGLMYLGRYRDGAEADTQGNVKIRESKSPIDITESANVDVNYSFYLIDTTDGNVVMTLPLPASAYFAGSKGLSFTFLKNSADANQVVIDTISGQIISGQLTKTLTAQRETITITTDGNQRYAV